MPYKNKEDRMKRQRERRDTPVDTPTPKPDTPTLEPDTPTPLDTPLDTPDVTPDKVNQGGVRSGMSHSLRPRRYNYSHDWYKKKS